MLNQKKWKVDIMDKEIIYKKENDIGFIFMNTSLSNKMTTDFLNDFFYILDNKVEKNLKGLIITTEKRHFSVGADVDMLFNTMDNSSVQSVNEDNLPLDHVNYKKSLTSLENLNFPVISAIRGFCIGSGFEIALNSHIRICERKATLGLPETTFGILPALGGILRTFELSGFSQTINLIFSGEFITPTEAYEYGLIDLLTEKKESVETSINLINYIYENQDFYDKKMISKYIENFVNIYTHS